MRPVVARAARALFLAALLAAASSAAAAAAERTRTVVVAAWEADGGALAPAADVPVRGDRRDLYARIEAYVWQALPPDVRPRIARLELFIVRGHSDDANDGTVVETDDGSGWILALDAREGELAVGGDDRADDEVFDEVIVHEVGHVLSLSPDQMAAGGAARGTYVVEEGTLRPNSWLNRFYEQFWRGRYPGWKETEDPADAAALYRRNRASFVTEYAATSPVEDFAESFTVFVLGDRPRGTAEKDRKVLFFWAIPALVRERETMRAGLSSVN